MTLRRTTFVLVTALLAGCSANQSTSSNSTLAPPSEAPDAATIEAPDAAGAGTAIIVDTADAEVLTAQSTEPQSAARDSGPSATDAASDATIRDGASSAHTTHASHSSVVTSTGNSNNSTSATASPAVAEARAVFERTCGRCHPGGERRVGPRLAGRNDSEAHLRDVVRNGDGTMRPIPASRLSDGDLAKVIVFLRSIRGVR